MQNFYFHLLERFVCSFFSLFYKWKLNLSLVAYTLRRIIIFFSPLQNESTFAKQISLHVNVIFFFHFSIVLWNDITLLRSLNFIKFSKYALSWLTQIDNICVRLFWMKNHVFIQFNIEVSQLISIRNWTINWTSIVCLLLPPFEHFFQFNSNSIRSIMHIFLFFSTKRSDIVSFYLTKNQIDWECIWFFCVPTYFYSTKCQL